MDKLTGSPAGRSTVIQNQGLRLACLSEMNRNYRVIILDSFVPIALISLNCDTNAYSIGLLLLDCAQTHRRL